jgi:hypothetical protein
VAVMTRSLQNVICLTALAAGVMLAGPQDQKREDTQKTVSGPAQINPKKPTGKSYKKGTKGTMKVDGSNTGQSRRLGNSGNLTSSGDKKQTKQSQKGDKNSPNPK